MGLNQLSILENEPSKGLHFDNLDKLLNYVHYMNAGHVFEPGKCKKYGEFTKHPFESTLFFDKYIETADPDLQLTFLFESQGILNFNADLDQDRQFKHKLCKDKEGAVTEMLYPNVLGEHFNPYKRYCNSVSSASHQCSKIVDLAGVDLCFYDIATQTFDQPTVFNDMILTYPEIISNTLLDPVLRESTIDRSKKCSKRFFDRLHRLFHLSPNQQLGCSVNTHTWVSESPFLPHLHHHMFLPHFSYDRTKTRGSNTIQHRDTDLQRIYDQFESVFAVIECGTVKHTSKNHYGSMGAVSTSNTEKKVIHKYLIDEDLYNSLRLELSEELSYQLGFKQLEWFGCHFKGDNEIPDPLAIGGIKQLWAKIVSKEFTEYGSWDTLDIKTQYIKADQRSKLLHALTYKTRPPVLDLDLFLKSCPDFVINYNKLNTGAVLDYLQSLFIKLALADNPKALKVERVLDRAKKLFESVSNPNLYSWLEFLAISTNNAHVYGFWHRIKRYLLDPDHKFLIESVVCPICGGTIESVGYARDAFIDGVIVRSRSHFMIYTLSGG